MHVNMNQEKGQPFIMAEQSYDSCRKFCSGLAINKSLENEVARHRIIEQVTQIKGLRERTISAGIEFVTFEQNFIGREAPPWLGKGLRQRSERSTVLSDGQSSHAANQACSVHCTKQG